jgi:hypothetical protein
MKRTILILLASVSVWATEPRSSVPDTRPVATIDLATSQGVALARAQWRYSDTRIVETEFVGPVRTDSRPGLT